MSRTLTDGKDRKTEPFTRKEISLVSIPFNRPIDKDPDEE